MLADRKRGDAILGKAPKGAEEPGDQLFTLTPLARQLKLDTNHALRAWKIEFIRGFKTIELGVEARYREAEHTSFDEVDALRQKAEHHEHQGF